MDHKFAPMPVKGAEETKCNNGTLERSCVVVLPGTSGREAAEAQHDGLIAVLLLRRRTKTGNFRHTLGER